MIVTALAMHGVVEVAIDLDVGVDVDVTVAYSRVVSGQNSL